MAGKYLKQDGDGIDGIVMAYFGSISLIGEVHFGRDPKFTKGIKGVEQTPINTSWFFTPGAFRELSQRISKRLVDRSSRGRGRCWVTLRLYGLTEEMRATTSYQMEHLTVEVKFNDYAWAHRQCLQMVRRIERENRPKMVMAARL